MLDVAVRLLHIELLAEAEIAKDVKDEVVDLLCHVQRLGPHTIATLRSLLPDEVEPSAGEDVPSVDYLRFDKGFTYSVFECTNGSMPRRALSEKALPKTRRLRAWFSMLVTFHVLKMLTLWANER